MPSFEIDPLIAQAANRLDVPYHAVEWFAWPEAFPTTAGPSRGMIAGQAFTTFQVFAFRVAGADKGLMYCAGHWQDWGGAMQERWK
jgi:hypothetical protein